MKRMSEQINLILKNDDSAIFLSIGDFGGGGACTADSSSKKRRRGRRLRRSKQTVKREAVSDCFVGRAQDGWISWIQSATRERNAVN